MCINTATYKYINVCGLNELALAFIHCKFWHRNELVCVFFRVYRLLFISRSFFPQLTKLLEFSSDYRFLRFNNFTTLKLNIIFSILSVVSCDLWLT